MIPPHSIERGVCDSIKEPQVFCRLACMSLFYLFMENIMILLECPKCHSLVDIPEDTDEFEIVECQGCLTEGHFTELEYLISKLETLE